MKTTTIHNQFLKAEFNHKGAELSGLFAGEKNFIWKVDEKFWDKTSPVLFPIVGGLKNNSYEYKGEKFELPRHGFAREMEFEVIESFEDSIVFSLQFSEKTLKVYPFKFTLNIKYYLIEKELFIKYTVINNFNEKMYYSIGAHPAFSIDGIIENYEMKFDKAEDLTIYKLADNLFSGKTEKIKLNEDILPLNYHLFEKDAIVLKNSATKSITLLKNKIPELKVKFSDFPYLGIWTKQNAPFICIEPWLGIADNANASGKLEEKEGIQVLEGNSFADFQWSVEIL